MNLQGRADYLLNAWIELFAKAFVVIVLCQIDYPKYNLEVRY